jgi:hypothetical protein
MSPTKGPFEKGERAYPSDIGRIYIKGYLYPISYPIPLSLFWAGYVEGYDILILGISKFYILSYILFRGTFALQNAFFC